MTHAFLPGEEVIARHPVDRNWYPAVIDHLDKVTGLYIVHWTHKLAHHSSWMNKMERVSVDPDDIRRKRG